MKKILLLVVPLLFLCLNNGICKENKIEVIDTVIYATPPNAKNGSFFATIKNLTKNDIVLTNVESDICNVCEIHTHIKENNMMKMVPVKEFKIGALDEKKLVSGGDHIMLIGLKKPLKAGDNIKIKLIFNNKDIVEKILKVEKK